MASSPPSWWPSPGPPGNRRLPGALAGGSGMTTPRAGPRHAQGQELGRMSDAGPAALRRFSIVRDRRSGTAPRRIAMYSHISLILAAERAKDLQYAAAV